MEYANLDYQHKVLLAANEIARENRDNYEIRFQYAGENLFISLYLFRGTSLRKSSSIRVNHNKMDSVDTDIINELERKIKEMEGET